MFRCVCFLATTLALTTFAQAADHWKIIATYTLDADKTSISVALPLAARSVQALRLYTRAYAGINNIVVVDGDDFKHEFNAVPLELGYGTNSIKPKNRDSFVSRIEFDYRVPRSSAPVTLDVWGQEASSGTDNGLSDDVILPWACRAITDPATGYPTNPPLANFSLNPSEKTARVEVGRLTGCSELKLRAEGEEVFVKDVVLEFANGQTDTIAVYSKLAPGALTSWFGIDGSDTITAVNLTYIVKTDVKISPRITIQARTTVEMGEFTAARLEAEKLEPVNSYVSGQPYRVVGCVIANTCTPVEVFFGTNRKRKDADGRIGFGSELGDLTLGSSIVTVPKAHGIGRVERPSYWSVRDLYHWMNEDGARHFVIVKDGITIFANEDDFVSAVHSAMGNLTEFKDQAFIFIHGFNVTFDDALYQTAQLAFDMGTNQDSKRAPYGVPFLFSWPAVGGDLGLANYETDGKSVKESEEALRSFLQMVVAKSGATKVHLICHSMGNRALLDVLDKVIQEQNPNIHFDQIILAAPDVGANDFIAFAKRFAPFVKRNDAAHPKLVANNITLYASSRDKAMWLSRGYNGVPRAGDVPKDGPIVEADVDTIDVSDVSTDVFAVNHSVYASSSELLDDMALLVRNDTRPPDLRTPILRMKSVGTLPFWYYP